MLRNLFGRPSKATEDDVRLENSLPNPVGRLWSAQLHLPGQRSPTGFREELEETLILGDVASYPSPRNWSNAPRNAPSERTSKRRDAYLILQQEMVRILTPAEPMRIDDPRLLTIVLVVGVNGSGKTTTIGKMAYWYKNRGRKVVLGAADTFRAAAIDQLKIWGERAGVDVIAHEPGADPGAVVFDAMRASQESRQADLLIVDTAGRLQTKYNLMQELEKIKRVAAKQVHRAPHEVFLVLDASTGQNAISQAKSFKDSAGVTGIILTKLDGTSKGGAVLSINHELGVPVRFVGTGEQIADFAEFDPVAFVEGLVGQ